MIVSYFPTHRMWSKRTVFGLATRRYLREPGGRRKGCGITGRVIFVVTRLARVLHGAPVNPMTATLKTMQCGRPFSVKCSGINKRLANLALCQKPGVKRSCGSRKYPRRRNTVNSLVGFVITLFRPKGRKDRVVQFRMSV